ncbi:Increased DNA methylation 1 [Sesamum alatum]|uniref:Increased DNA methylation 1 n=1 Tax=Sesamum alatum TaxID=300844 RepID=A0AAE1Y8I1_9LAMI|nr:Increased DNA methylation 1 [Sesamum alatum]
MEGSVRSGGGVLKKKTSSGCLIIKNKVQNRNSGGGSGGLSVNSNEKKRPRLLESDSGSSDEDESLEFMRRKVNDKRLHNDSMGYKRSELENREYDRNNVGVDIHGERKRSRVDLFEFDEYDEFDGKRMRNEYVEDTFQMFERSGGGKSKEFAVGPSHRNLLVDKRNPDSYFNDSSSGRSKGVEYTGLRDKGPELEEDEAHMPISLLRLKYQESGNEPIRLQGKNGVLKVMVNKKKKIDLHSHHKKYDPSGVEDRTGARSENVVKKDLSIALPVYPPSKPPEKRGLFVDKEKTIGKEKMEVKLEKTKPILGKGIKARESETNGMNTDIKARESGVDGTDTALKLAPPGPQACSSKKGMKKEKERTPPPENVTPVKGKEGKEGKAKRGGSTEKQMLREKIRGMLTDAGWTIDYRPRRNRDYLDAVYINPCGTAYWSIIKAYDALKKQLEEDNTKSKSSVRSPSFAPLSEDLIHKLTRQTKKKIEEEMKRKIKEDGMTKNAKRSAVRDAGESSGSDQNEERLSSYMKQNYKSQGGELQDVDQDSDDDLSDDSANKKLRKIKFGKPSIASHSNVLQEEQVKLLGDALFLSVVLTEGKTQSLTAKLSEKVQYMNRRRTRVMLEGWITRDGIHCGCCSKILTVSKFELHAGSKLRQPFQNIFLESGVSLLQCQIDAWNRQGESLIQDFHTVDVDGDDPDDDTCGICGDGGALICCDGCPSTFHQTCLGIQMLPSGDWHCPNCTCKFCGDAGENVDEGNGTTTDDILRCSFYHKSCSERVHALPSSCGASFCGLKCQELYDHLQKILGVKHELEAGFSWSLIQRTDVSDTSHRGFPQKVECNSKLAVALSVMDECFLPIIDRRSGINMIHNVVYNCGSNFNRLNYRGFYTAILERGDEIVSAASIRIHGTRLAEMPFIGTREIYRRQGMCRRLLCAIETELCSLKVEHLIIPAISEHMNTWTRVFGFHQLEDVLKREIKSMNMLVFPGTDMLQKQLVKQEISDGVMASKSIKNELQSPVLVEKSDLDSSMEHYKQMSCGSGVCHDTKINEKINALDSGSPAPAGPSNDSSAARASDSVCQSDIDLSSREATMVKTEVENKQNNLSTSFKRLHTHGESNNISDMEKGLLDTPLKDYVNSSEECVIGNGCKTEAPFLKSIRDSSNETIAAAEANGNQNSLALESAEFANSHGNVGFLLKGSVDAEPKTVVTNGSAKSQSGSVFEPSAQDTRGKVNGEHVASLPTTVVNEENSLRFKSNQDQPPILESEVSLSVEPSTDTAAAPGPKVAIDDVDENERCGGQAFCSKKNVKTIGPQLAFGSSLVISAKDAVETINENRNPAPVSTFRDSGESILTSNSEIDQNVVLQVQNHLAVSVPVPEESVDPTETNTPDAEIKIPLAVNGKVASPISSSEALAQNSYH